MWVFLAGHAVLSGQAERSDSSEIVLLIGMQSSVLTSPGASLHSKELCWLRSLCGSGCTARQMI